MNSDDDLSAGGDIQDAPIITAEAPGFDMLAEADEDNQVAKSDSYQVLARKYRPKNFDDLIGQEAMVQTLTNAFESGRIAHAFMLTGVRGVGKTTTARILARALNYSTDGAEGADGPSMALADLGAHCEAIMQGSHVDVIEMDAASRTGIGDIREIIENVRYMPASARYKVYIIDEVHMLSKAAFNGLLKTLEEPPEHVKFIFATTEIRQVPVTVLSRCQRFDLRRLGPDDTHRLLHKVCAAENEKVPEEALALISRAADGSARDALSLLDRALAHIDPEQNNSEGLNADTMRTLLGLADRGRVFDLFDMMMSGKVPEALAEFEAQYNMGADPAVILADLAELTHWLTRLKFVEGAGDDVTFSAPLRQRGQQAAEALPTRVLSRAWQVLLQGHDETLRAVNTRAAAEMVLIRMAHLADAPTPEELIKKLETAPADAPAAAPAGAASPSSNMSPQAGASSSPMGSPMESAVGSPMESAVGSAPRSAAGSAETAQQSKVETAFQTPVLQTFSALIALVDDHRDIGLKHALENGVHLVRFEPAHGDRAGRVELRLAEGQPNIAQDLTRKLRQWTGQNWVISLSSESGAATLGSLRQSEAERRHAAALEDPQVKSVLAVFPGAQIVSVNDYAASSLDTPDDGQLPIDADDQPDEDA
ncbi:DNA polymerase III subunit gamma/tau [Alphaproteobacteria bacterium]|nr:DNA polymerase III subunit gamma/tau [Alphaproteobacteria bacterium]